MEDFYKDLAANSIKDLGEYSEARVESKLVKELSMKNGVLLGAASFHKQGIGVRFFEKGSLGFCSTNDFEKVNEVVGNAAKITRKAVNASENYKLSREETHKAKYVVEQKEKLADVGIAQCVELLKNVDSSLLAQGIESRFLSLELETIEKFFVNSEGTEVHCLIPRINFHYLLTFSHVQRFWQKGASGGWEIVRRWNLEESIQQEASEISKANQTSERITGKTDLVVSPEIAGIIAHESCGHPYELDRILGREAAQAGGSFITLNMIGTKISNECVSVIDDPTVKNGHGFFLFDDEGVKAKPVRLIDKGKINALLTDRANAAILNQKSNGNSRTSSFDCEPLIRMSNTFFEPSEKSEEELLEETKNGVYFKRFMEWNIDDLRFNQKYVACEAYKIENGEVTVPVKNPVIEISTPELYAAITGVASNLEFHAACCGKGEPMQGMPVYMGGPSLQIKGINLK